MLKFLTSSHRQSLNARQHSLAARMWGHTAEVHTVAIAPNGKFLATGGERK
jgi:hypothetical protein